jgi:hypothetical protein
VSAHGRLLGFEDIATKVVFRGCPRPTTEPPPPYLGLEFGCFGFGFGGGRRERVEFLRRFVQLNFAVRLTAVSPTREDQQQGGRDGISDKQTRCPRAEVPS